MANSEVIVREIWSASVLDFLGFELYRVELHGRDADWYYDAPSLDVQAYLSDYEKGCLVLSDAKAYSHAFTRLSKIQNDMRRRGETSWCSESWIAGRVGK
jgi:hypothetical protein